MKASIEYSRLGDSGISVSKVCLGTWAIGGTSWGGTDEQESIATIRSALDRGITFIDTAPVYGFGRSEEIVGKALQGHIARDQVVLATKVGLDWDEKGRVWRDSTRARIMREIDDSLKRLQTDYVDLYLVHWPDPLTPVEETARAMNEILKSGKARAIGVSNYSPAQMDVFRKFSPLHCTQPPYNLFERQIEADILPYARRNGLAVMGYGSLCRGLLTGTMKADTKFPGDDLRNNDPKFKPPRYSQYLRAVYELDALVVNRYQRHVLALAVRWVLDQGVIALWGARHPMELDPLRDVFGWQLTKDDLKDIDTLLRETIKEPIGPEFFAPPAREVPAARKAV
jgi:aryl-alcohol dehydrogenase-like predicted oxidoreductase